MAPAHRGIRELAGISSKTAKLINLFLIFHDLSFPFFDNDAPEKLFFFKELIAIRAVVNRKPLPSGLRLSILHSSL